MQTHKNNNGFTQRLNQCVERVGGKRAMATNALISEAQLFRYINGESDVPSDRLVAMAKAAEVDAGWLLTGTGAIEGFKVDVKPSFRPDLMVQVVQTFEELLIESDKRFTPRQKALATTLIYEALRLEEMRKQTELNVDKRLAPFYPDFLAPLRSDTRMEDYIATMNALELSMDVGMQSLKQFDTLVKLGLTSAYEGSMGEIYFEKMGTALLPEATKTLIQQVETASTLLKKSKLDWLDAGCGNGRHLAFLSQHFPHLNLHGIDVSQLAVNYCEKLVVSGKLPVGVVQSGDLRNLPYPNDSLDVVYCRAGLYVLPYIPGQAVGALQYMYELARVLRPGGLAMMLTPEGSGRDYVIFIQYHSVESIKQMAKDCGLELVSATPSLMNETGGTPGKDYSNKLNNGLQIILRKPQAS